MANNGNRNMMELVEQHEHDIPENYNLVLMEMRELHYLWLEDPIKAISTAFTYGFICGNRATQKGKVKNL